MSRDLSGRCGTCGWYIRKREEPDGSWLGDCRLGQGHWPLKDTATCSSHKSREVPWDQALKRRPAAGVPRKYRDEPAQRPRPTIPSEIGIDMDQETFRQVLREVLLDELGVRDVELGDRWQGGELVLVPGKSDTQEKRIPLEVFFKKVVMVRDKLRVLEQKINGHRGLTDEEKVQLQHYITGCYGSLTTFNVLFKHKEDQFTGQKK
ncbi:MAG TPA: hypothetical protein VLS88_10635 [Polyangiales bacterium]|nr:hypothetical protein [Polyangiales bacterium]